MEGQAASKRKETRSRATIQPSLEDTMLSAVSQLGKLKKPVLCDSICTRYRVVEFIETESRRVVARGRWEGGRGSCFVGIEFQFCKMKRVLEIDCTTV